MMRASIGLGGVVLGAALLSACSQTPVRPTPVLAMPAAFKEATNAVPNVGTSAIAGAWWQVFQSAELDGLMAEAMGANASLAAAAARVGQARALVGVAQGARSVQVDVNGGIQRARSRSSTTPGPARNAANSWQAGIAASYEVDLFNGIGAAVSAARLDAEAQQASYRAVQLVLQADLAQTWLRLRATDAELITLERTAQLWAEQVSVNQRRYELGDIGEFDLARARTELATARAEATGLQRQRSQLEHALAVLLGRPAAAFTAAAQPLGPDAVLPAIPAGFPSALLRRRPDIHAAQRDMDAARARIGVAKAALLPSLTLGLAGGRDGPTVRDLLSGAGHGWLIDAVLSLPVIDGGRRQAGVARSEAVYDEAAAQWRQQVLQAFAEVEDNLAGLRTLAGQAGDIDSAVQSARRAADLAELLYRGGRSSYLELLDARRQLAAVERSAVQLRGSRAVATVALIRSLGGGWEERAEARNENG